MMLNRWIAGTLIVVGLLLAACSPGDAVSADAAGTEQTRLPLVQESSNPLLQIGATPIELDAMSIVAAQERLLGEIYQRLLPSVVKIEVSQTSVGRAGSGSIPFGFGQGDVPGQPDLFPSGEGSGFVWDDAGHVVTNWHVIEGAEGIIVVFSDGAEYDAEVVGSDPDSDIAVLNVSFPDGLYPAVGRGNSDLVDVGQLVLAIGSPFGQDFTLTSGIVSAVGRTIQSGSRFAVPEVIQTDAAINPGNSGGPLLDRTGAVIGINTQIISRSGANSGVGFAIPIEVAERVVPVLIRDGAYHYAWLGIGGVTLRASQSESLGLDRDQRGVLVSQVATGGPADEAGLLAPMDNRQADVITAIGGIPTPTMDDLIAYVSRNGAPDQTVSLSIIRDGKPQELTVTLRARPAT